MMIRKTLCLLLALLALTLPALAEETDNAPLDPRVQPAVAISFDDGPSEFTQQVLDVLAENGFHGGHLDGQNARNGQGRI